MFSGFEHRFQRQLFPARKSVSLPICYDHAFYLFACSMSWRALTYLKFSTPDEHVTVTNISKLLSYQIPKELHKRCDNALERWQNVIANGGSAIKDQHLIFLNGKNVHYERSDVVGFTVFRDTSNLAVVSILGPVIILGIVVQGEGWLRTCIEPDGAVFSKQPQQVPASFGKWLQKLYSGLQEVAH